MRAIVAVLLSLALGTALAQGYPNRAVKVIVPWPTGQATDIAARVVAQKLQEQLGQPFVIDNKPGAGGAIGSEAVVKSPADGYTLLAASSGPLSIMPHLQKVPYEPLKDLAPISLVAATPFALVVNPSFPANNAKEFIALVRANPGKYTFSSSGTGATAHLFTELFNSMAGLQARHIPYKGTPPALTDIMNGQVTYTVETVAATAGHIKSGRLKTFGVSTARRTAALPDVPPLTELGVKDFDAASWFMLVAPGRTPKDVIAKLYAELRVFGSDREMRNEFVRLGLVPVESPPPEALKRFVATEIVRWADVVRRAGLAGSE